MVINSLLLIFHCYKSFLTLMYITHLYWKVEGSLGGWTAWPYTKHIPSSSITQLNFSNTHCSLHSNLQFGDFPCSWSWLLLFMFHEPSTSKLPHNTALCCCIYCFLVITLMTQNFRYNYLWYLQQSDYLFYEDWCGVRC